MKEINDISNKEKLLSIIVPIYNVEKYLTQCLESLVKQDISPDDYEIILVDDGSTDGSFLIYEKYAKEYPNISILKQKNCGQSVARNAGLYIAKGKYVWFVDADDYIKPGVAGFVLKKMEEENLELLFFDAEVEYEVEISFVENQYDRFGLIEENKVVTGRDFFEMCRKKGCAIVSPCMVIFSKAYLAATEVLFLPGRIYEDNLFFFSNVMRAERTMYVAEKMYVRRYRENSTMTKPLGTKNINDMMYITGEIIKEIHKFFSTCSEQLKNEMMLYVYDLIIKILKMCTDAQMEKEDRVESRVQAYALFLSTYERLMKQKRETITDIRHILLVLSDFQLSELTKLQRQKVLRKVYGERYANVYMTKLSYEERLRSKYIEFFNSHRFSDKTCTIGIYGKGVHTKNMMQICQLYLGKIEANIVYVDSDISVKTDRKENVIHVSEVLGIVDEVLISSFKYEDEMFEIAFNTVKNAIPIHRIYLQEARSIF